MTVYDVGFTRLHWITMLNQSYFGSRNALIHCIVLSKADV